MAFFHSRSNSLPSKCHPVMEDVENLACRIKSSEAASISSIDSLCSNLANLRDLHEEINDMVIQMPSVRQAITHDFLETSLILVDLCGFSRDVIYSTKESLQKLESSIRRNRADIDAYAASRKNIIKKVNKSIKNLKGFNQQKENDLTSSAKMLKEMQTLDFSILRSVLMFLSGEKERSKQRSWSLLSKKFTYSQEDQENSADEELCCLDICKSRKNMDNISMLKQFKASEMFVQEIEAELEALFESLIKTRVALLNAISY